MGSGNIAQAPTGLVFHVARREQQPILTIAAREGFPGMTSFYLQKLASHLGVRVESAKSSATLPELLRALISAVLPNTDAQLIDEAMRRRGISKVTLLDSAFTTAPDLDLFEEVLEQEDHQDLKRKVTNHLAEKRSRSGGNAQNNVSVAAAGPQRAWQLRPMPSQTHWSIEEARQYMPTIPKAALSVDLKRFSRWSAFYPREAVPRFVTKSWGPQTGMDVRQALVHVLSTVWAWHQAETR